MQRSDIRTAGDLARAGIASGDDPGAAHARRHRRPRLGLDPAAGNADQDHLHHRHLIERDVLGVRD